MINKVARIAMKIILFVMFMTMSFVSSGAVIIVKGLPMPLEYRNEIYLLPPANITPANVTYLYITMDGINKACSLNTQSDDVFDQISQVNFMIDGVKTEWNCHAYKTTVIEVLPW